MTKVIYRKYRPQKFSEVIGQEHVKTTLQNQIKLNQVSHAYIFSGQRGIGKTTIARLLAKTMNCQNRKDDEAEPCNICNNCKEMNEGRSIDIIEIDAASHTGVDNVRDNIINAVRFMPNKSSYKVFIIDEVHMLSTQAFNALLKTLEEPPQHGIFILATTEIHKIPQTILSRCQRFDFKRIETNEMKDRLKMILKNENIEVEDDVLNLIARISEGCLRDAESLLGQVLAIGGKKIDMDIASLVLPATHFKIALEILDHASKNEIKNILDLLDDFVQQGGSVKHLINELMEIVRYTMMYSLNSDYKMSYDENSNELLKRISDSLGTEKCVNLIELLISAKTKIGLNTYPQLPLEILFVDFCDIKDQKKSEPIKEKVLEDDFTESEGRICNDAKPVIISEEIGVIEKDEVSDNEPNELTIKTSDDGSQTIDSDLVKPFEINDLTSKWGRVCEAVKKRNIALPLVLQEAKPLRFEDGKLIIGFEREFHYATIKEVKNCLILSEAIDEIMQSKVKLDVEHIIAKEEEVASDLANAFGGAVIG